MTASNTVEKLRNVPIEDLEGLAMEVLENSAVEEKIVFTISELLFLRLYSGMKLVIEDKASFELMHTDKYSAELGYTDKYNDIELTFMKR